MPRGEARRGPAIGDRIGGGGRRGGRCGGGRSRSWGRCLRRSLLSPLPSLPFPRAVVDGLLPWWATKGQSPQQPAWAAPAPPVRPIIDQRPKPTRGPRRSKAALAGVRLATLRHGLAGWRAGPALVCGGRWMLLTCVRGVPSDTEPTAGTPREVRVGRKTEIIAVTLAISAAVGGRLGRNGKPPAHRAFCKRALQCFWIPISTGLIWCPFYHLRRMESWIAAWFIVFSRGPFCTSRLVSCPTDSFEKGRFWINKNRED